jgi:catechol 2,3-dioxygenase-like lactoylglutathione lyase family enzyme
MPPARGSLHHLELWVRDLEAARTSWGWLLDRLGYARGDVWERGESWHLDDAYVVIESGPDVLDVAHERRRPGVNHVAFHAGTRAEVDELTAEAAAHGWSLMFADRHPYAGGVQHYAAYLEDAAGFEVELVGDDA